MSRVFATLRGLWREFADFGKADFEALRQRNLQLQEQIQQVRARREALERLEVEKTREAVAAVVTNAEGMRASLQAETQTVVRAVDEMGKGALDALNAGLAEHTAEAFAKARDVESVLGEGQIRDGRDKS